MFDSLAAAMDWLDAYRNKSLAVVDLYAPEATLECGCGGTKIIASSAALKHYWTDRFRTRPAGELVDVEPAAGNVVIVTYQTESNVIQSYLGFDEISGKIGGSSAPQRIEAGVRRR